MMVVGTSGSLLGMAGFPTAWKAAISCDDAIRIKRPDQRAIKQAGYGYCPFFDWNDAKIEAFVNWSFD
ncbi:MAG: hypothetical protein KKE57_08480 [Proteobacteria bacterium]|nr:hypothetical protein [Pseudomonadota bacterium]